MAVRTTDDGQLPLFFGESGEPYRRWKASILWAAAATSDEKRRLFAPKVIAKALRGDPQEFFRDQNAAEFRQDDGIDRMFAILDPKYGQYAEVELCHVVTSFFYKNRRNHSEPPSTYAARYKTTAARMERLVTSELERESQRQFAVAQ